MPSESTLQIGSVAIIFLFAVKEFFSYLKSKKNSDNNNSLNDAILQELRIMNTNHLHTIQTVIENGNDKIANALIGHGESEHNDSMRIVQLLGEIKGSLNSIK